MTSDEEVRSDESTLNRSQSDEPVFVLVARDKLAPAVVRVWAEMAKAIGVSWTKTAAAEVLASHMESWARIHGSKVPD